MNDNNASDGRQDLVLLWCYNHTCERVWLYLKSGGGLVVNVYCKQAIIKVTLSRIMPDLLTKRIRQNAQL